MQGCQGRRNPLDIPFATGSNQTKFVEFSQPGGVLLGQTVISEAQVGDATFVINRSLHTNPPEGNGASSRRVLSNRDRP